MTSIQKFQILNSLDGMNPAQMHKVQQYIARLLRSQEHEYSEDRFKAEAMRQIRQALRETTG